MNKGEAIKKCKAITSGSGVDREYWAMRVVRGLVARDWWDNTEFGLGVEYGVIIGLMEAFDLTTSDIWGDLNP